MSGAVALPAISTIKYTRMPIASAFSAPITAGERRRARAIGSPRKIVSPANKPSSAVAVNDSGPRGLPFEEFGMCMRIAAFIALARCGVPA